MKRFLRPSVILFGLWAGAACGSDDPESCLSDTDCDGAQICVDSTCVEASDASVDVASSDAATDSPAADVVDAEPDVFDAAPDAAGIVGVDPPPDAEFPEIIDTISVAIRTLEGEFSGTDASTSICVNATQCFRLNVDEVNDLEPGRVDVHHFSGLNLPREDVDRIVLRTNSDPAVNNDRYEPACLHVRFDGEPVYCTDEGIPPIGTNGGDELIQWRDPQGLHQDCVSCWGDRALTHGPVQGAPGDRSANIWVRTDATRTVGIRVGESPDLAGAPIVAWAQPSPADDFTAKLSIHGLNADTPYYYRVEIPEVSSVGPVHPMRARVGEGRDEFSFAFGSCSAGFTQAPLEAALADRPDLFFFVGDNHYANAQIADAHRYHYRHHRFLSPRRSLLLAAVPTVAVWDDHDFLNNNSHSGCRGAEEALEAFSQYWVNPSFGTDETPGVFFRHREGPVEFFGLDCRMYRPDIGDPLSRCEEDINLPVRPRVDGPLGAEQNAWLREAIVDSTATYKVLACGTRFTEHAGVDSWSSFPEARVALEGFLHTERVEGVVFISGDVHRSMLRLNTRVAGYAIPELTSSPLDINTPSACPDETGLRFCTSENSYIRVFTTTAGIPALNVEVRAADGEIRHEWVIPREALEY